MLTSLLYISSVVQLGVLDHIPLLCEGLPANMALVRPYSVMHPGMVEHIPSPLKDLVAVLVLSLVNSVRVASLLIDINDRLILEPLKHLQVGVRHLVQIIAGLHDL